MLVDKDQNPKWNPSTLEEVTDRTIEQCFSSLGEKDLTLWGPTFKHTPPSLRRAAAAHIPLWYMWEREAVKDIHRSHTWYFDWKAAVTFNRKHPGSLPENKNGNRRRRAWKMFSVNALDTSFYTSGCGAKPLQLRGVCINMRTREENMISPLSALLHFLWVFADVTWISVCSIFFFFGLLCVAFCSKLISSPSSSDFQFFSFVIPVVLHRLKKGVLGQFQATLPRKWRM